MITSFGYCIFDKELVKEKGILSLDNFSSTEFSTPFSTPARVSSKFVKGGRDTMFEFREPRFSCCHDTTTVRSGKKERRELGRAS